MPRLVDHAEKRQEIIRATWRLVAERGFEAATMREIATYAGHANGALSHYFSNKEEILRAAYLFVWEATNARIADRLGEATGLDAIRIYWQEIAPGSTMARMEARIVMPFFARAGTDPALADITRSTLDQWRRELANHLDEARAAGVIRSDTPTPAIVEQLLTLLLGLQITTSMDGRTGSVTDHDGMLDTVLAGLT